MEHSDGSSSASSATEQPAQGAAAHDHREHDQSGHGEHNGHGSHGGHGDHVAQFRRLFWIMLVVGIPVVLLSDVFAMIIGYPLPGWPWLDWVSPILGTVMFVWGGRPFLSGGVSELRARRPGMMLLISLAITVAFLASWGAQLGLLNSELEFWWELALLIVIMLLGHWIEMRSLAASASALDSLAALLPDVAERVEGSEVVEVAPPNLRVGDVVVVRPGGRVPADGEVISGSASVDESMITGESRPVARTEGDRVVAGTVSTDSSLRVRVAATGEDTALAGIQRLVAEAQNSSSRAQLLADRAAAWLFWFALAAAVITAVIWTALGQPADALVRSITVLVIACPHALGLAIPLVVAIATERAARGGILITDRMALEAMRTVEVVLFDKTGTLTEGRPVVNDVLAVPGVDEDELLGVAAAAESESEHPLAKAIVALARERRIEAITATDFSSSPAVGITATVGGRQVSVGGPAMLRTQGLEPLAGTQEWRSRGSIVLHVLVDGRIAGALSLADKVRSVSREAVEALHAIGRRVVMITGDAPQVADAVAQELGIDRVFAGVRPEDKGDKVAELQAEGRRVAMVGDGVNDAPALARAGVGIAIGAGTDVAIASAGVVLASDDPRSVLSVIELSKQGYRKMQQNLVWGAGYNLISVPLAAGILAPFGFVLPMAVGALFMSASTVVVALNAQLLRRLDLSPEAGVRAAHRG
ncbi:MAG TPA: heavy metal translocating P-type ATPase [Microlunatus sp.]